MPKKRPTAPARRGKKKKKKKRAAPASRTALKKWLPIQRAKLERERESLRREIEVEAGLLKVMGTSNPTEDADLAEEQREDDEVARTVAVLQTRLAQVQEALERMERGMYGVCFDCQSPIPQRRLEAMPSAARCTACQNAFEKTS